MNSILYLKLQFKPEELSRFLVYTNIESEFEFEKLALVYRMLQHG